MKASIDSGLPADSLRKHPPPLQPRVASEYSHRSGRLFSAQTALSAPAQRENTRMKRSGTLNAATVRLESHGCPKNLVDGEQTFRAKGAAGQSVS